MKATIKDDGTLCVLAENGLEQFALKRWAESYMEKKGDPVVLFIDFGMGNPIIPQPSPERRELPDPPPDRGR